MKSGIILFYLSFIFSLGLCAQKWTTLELMDMSAFRPQAGNWQIKGDVFMDRHKDVHHFGNSGVTASEGRGVLVNLNNESQKDALLTAWEHEDIEIEFEFMMPKGSNSGVYLQGRYEVQLFDSWGEKNPKFSDLGGIYRNWESTPGKIYMGKAPLANPAKAPGLWQTMYISFKAPRFDQTKNKIQNAKLNLVKINGTTIHENVEIPLPTGGPITNDEVSKGPLMIQGDHGAVAFRNIKYRLLENKKISVDKVSYRYWDGPHEYEDKFKNLPPKRSGSSPEGLTWEVAQDEDFFGLELSGNLNIPSDGKYYFSTISNGGMSIYINDVNVRKMIKAWDWDRPQRAEVDLKSGVHKIKVYLSRADAWLGPSLALFAESDNVAKTALHTFSSFKERAAIFPTYVHAHDKPKVLRAFLDFNNDPKLRRTHTVGVGDPTGLHYIFDNNLGVLSCVWRGDFVDASPMWHDRGDGSFRPIGNPIFLNNTPQLDKFTDSNSPFSNLYSEEDFRSKGYRMNEDTHTPIFLYKVKGISVSDMSYPDAISNSITRELKFDGDLSNAKFLLAHGKEILKLEDGSYLVDKKYYLSIDTQDKLQIRQINGNTELYADLQSNTLRYTLIW
jgi:hypothetical protein